MQKLLTLLYASLWVQDALSLAKEKSCTEDDLYTSLSKSGGAFCESVVHLHCEVSTPPEYSTYDNSQISSYCECIVTGYQTETGSSEYGVPTGSSLAFPGETSTDSQYPSDQSSVASSVANTSSKVSPSEAETTTKRDEAASSESSSTTATGNTTILQPGNSSNVATNAPSETTDSDGSTASEVLPTSFKSDNGTITGGPSSTIGGTAVSAIPPDSSGAVSETEPDNGQPQITTQTTPRGELVSTRTFTSASATYTETISPGTWNTSKAENDTTSSTALVPVTTESFTLTKPMTDGSLNNPSSTPLGTLNSRPLPSAKSTTRTFTSGAATFTETFIPGSWNSSVSPGPNASTSHGTLTSRGTLTTRTFTSASSTHTEIFNPSPWNGTVSPGPLPSSQPGAITSGLGPSTWTAAPGSSGDVGTAASGPSDTTDSTATLVPPAVTSRPGNSSSSTTLGPWNTTNGQSPSSPGTGGPSVLTPISTRTFTSSDATFTETMIPGGWNSSNLNPSAPGTTHSSVSGLVSYTESLAPSGSWNSSLSSKLGGAAELSTRTFTSRSLINTETLAPKPWNNTSTTTQTSNGTIDSVPHTINTGSLTTISTSSVSGVPPQPSLTRSPGSWNSSSTVLNTNASGVTPGIPLPTVGWNSTAVPNISSLSNAVSPGSLSTTSSVLSNVTAWPSNVTAPGAPTLTSMPTASFKSSAVNGTVIPTVVVSSTFSGWNTSRTTLPVPPGSTPTSGSVTGASGLPSSTIIPSSNSSSSNSNQSGQVSSLMPSFSNATAGEVSATSSASISSLALPATTADGITPTPFPTQSFTGSITGSVTTMAGLNGTSIQGVPSPTVIPDGNCTLWPVCNTTFPSPTAPLGTVVPAANFTSVTCTAHASQETCFNLEHNRGNEPSRRALLRNSKLREENVTIPVPYIESIDFSNGGLDPFFITVRDSSQNAFYIDISNKSRIALIDQGENSIILDWDGLHLATKNCLFDISFTIDDLYQQLADLSNLSCSSNSIPRRQVTKRSEDLQFNQTLYLHDQCGSPVSRAIRSYPSLSVGNTSCTDISISPRSGRWDFDCTFPGVVSGTLQCQESVQQDVIDFLVRDSFGNACPDLPTVIATLTNSASDLFGEASLRDAFSDTEVKANADDLDIDAAVRIYQSLWSTLRELFVLPAGRLEGGISSPFEHYISIYNENRSFQDDICEDLHAGEIPLSLSLSAGVTRIDAITTLNWAPSDAVPYNITVQDPAVMACCASGAVADDDGDSCSYPEDALISDTNCICGQAVDGSNLAFEGTECDNYDGECEENGDCQDGLICMTGTCCGGGVCVDPYACSQNGTALVKFRDWAM